MESENSGFRLIGNLITPITSKEEIKSIEEAINYPLKGVHTHITSALKLFSDKKNPDYGNSIKESINGVESICKLITGKDKATLGEALKKIDKFIHIHPALKKGFEKIYGYTSDECGIRHALLGESNITFTDAKYMLVSCSAFINYLVEKSNKAGIELKQK